MSEKKGRVCSQCREVGHTKRTCVQPLIFVDNSIKKQGRPAAPIVVPVRYGSSLSPHRVTLREEEKPPIWKDVRVYKEPVQAPSAVVSVAFDELVAKHNEMRGISDIPDVHDEFIQPVASQKDVHDVGERASAHSHDTSILHTDTVGTAADTVISPTTDDKLSSLSGVGASDVCEVRELAPSSPLKKHTSLKEWYSEWFERVANVCAAARDKIVWRQVLSVGVLLIFFLSIPLPAIGYVQRMKQTNATLVAQSTDGFLALQSSTVAALGSDMTQAEIELGRALGAFSAAEDLVDTQYQWLFSLTKFLPVIGPQVSSRQYLLMAGQHLALGNTYVVKGIKAVDEAKESPFTERLSILRTHIRSAVPQYEAARDELARVDIRSIPPEYQKSFQDFTQLFGMFVGDMREVVSLIDALQLVLGNTSFKRYLVVFQNNRELRPTGGFVGSMGVVDVQKGKILKVDVPPGGSYDLRGQLQVSVVPPTPIQLVNGRWEFQDANWFPDFSASAEKMAWFYEKSRPETVDGVIAVNASVLERVLRVLGPVDNDMLGKMISEYDALDTLQTHVESDEARNTNKPKEVLADLLQQLIDRLPGLQKADMVRLLTELHAAAQQKEIQIYIRDSAAQRVFQDFGWTGDIRQTVSGQDYLMVVNANLQGQKSDAKITQTIHHDALVSPDGSVIDTVTVRRTHAGESGTAFYGAPNISYIRFYVPEGAELISAEGFQYPPEAAFHVPESWYGADADLARIETNEQFASDSGTRMTREFGKTVFGNWVITQPGESREVRIRYRLPFRVIASHATPDSSWEKIKTTVFDTTRQRSEYSLLVQKQSGSTSDIQARVIYPAGWTPMWRSDDRIDLALNGAVYEGKLATDHLFSILFEQH